MHATKLPLLRRPPHSVSRSHLKEEAVELYLFDSAGLLSNDRVQLEVVAPGAGRGGTASSNPLCSSKESIANLTPPTSRGGRRCSPLGHSSAVVRGSNRKKTSASPFPVSDAFWIRLKEV